jgi:hypothetical protein
MALVDLYTHDVAVQRVVNTPDNYGGNTAAFAEHLSSYSCRIYNPTSNSAGMLVEDIGKITGVLVKAIGENADIKIGDKFIDGTYEYIVKRVYDTYEREEIHHKELLLDKIK